MMPLRPDPFIHLPILRDKIVEPAASRFRLAGKGVEKWDEMAVESGYPPHWRHTDRFRDQTRRDALRGRAAEDLWVFAYGSLMWDPAFFFEEVRCATAPSRRRSFCLRIELGRGAPGTPALMAALDAGGECHGLAFRIARDRIETETDMIWRREMITDGYRAAFVGIDTPQGAVEALTFLADHDSPKYVGDLAAGDAAAIIAAGNGALGTNIEYLDDVANRLRDLEVPDPEFFALYAHARALVGG